MAHVMHPHLHRPENVFTFEIFTINKIIDLYVYGKVFPKDWELDIKRRCGEQ